MEGSGGSLPDRRTPSEAYVPSPKISFAFANLKVDGMEKVTCVKSAKVPIVKIWDPELGLACDMNVNNTAALENTRMIRTYVEIDPRVRPLAMIIKHWTRRRIVNDAGRCFRLSLSLCRY